MKVVPAEHLRGREEESCAPSVRARYIWIFAYDADPDVARLIERIRAVRRSSGARHILVAAEQSSPDLARRSLEAGADDWVTSPLDSDEFQRQLAALERRICDAEGPGERVRVDDNARVLAVDGSLVRLTRTQFALLNCLIDRRGEWLGANELQRGALRSACRENASNVRYHVHQLRARLTHEHPSLARYLHSEPGLGYMWSEAECDRRHCRVTELHAR